MPICDSTEPKLHQNQTIFQQEQRIPRKRVLIGILSSKKYLATRGEALYNNWLKEVPSWFGDIIFFSEPIDNDLPVVQLRGVNDSLGRNLTIEIRHQENSRNRILRLEGVVSLSVVELQSNFRIIARKSGTLALLIILTLIDSAYPPQQKSFQMLAYFNDELRDQYDWFIRLDDDSVLQWENLNELLSKLYPQNQTLIGSPGAQFCNIFIVNFELHCENLTRMT